jgi:hypothetical protein
MEELNEEKSMGHEFTLLREWSWSPTFNLASGNTVCGPLLVIFISQISSKALGTRPCTELASSKVIKQDQITSKNSLYSHSFNHCLSFILGIPKE